MDDARVRFMKMMKNKDNPVCFTAKDVEAVAEEMARNGKAFIHVVFPDGAEANIPIKDALMNYWGFTAEAADRKDNLK